MITDVIRRFKDSSEMFGLMRDTNIKYTSITNERNIYKLEFELTEEVKDLNIKDNKLYLSDIELYPSRKYLKDKDANHLRVIVLDFETNIFQYPIKYNIEEV